MKTKNLLLIMLVTVLFVVAADQITKTIALHKAGLPLFSKKVPEGSKIIADGNYGEYIVKVGKISFHRTLAGAKLQLITLIAMPLVLVIYLRSGSRQDESKRNAFFRDLLFSLAWGGG